MFAGMADRIEEPYIDLYGSCVDRLLDWIWSSRLNGLAAVGAAPGERRGEWDSVNR
jgi:hypothetical protein